MSPRKAKPETRDALLAAARALFLRQGYTATGIDEICAAAGITKGALFHYFESKEALGQAALERWMTDQMGAFGSGQYLNEPDPLKRALGMVDFAIELSRMGPPGCLVGIFSQELAPSNEAVRATCASAFTTTRDAFERLVADAKAAYAPDAAFDPQSVAQHMLAVLQGALILARAYQRPEIVAEHLTHFRAYLASLFAVGGDAPAKTRRTSGTGSRRAAPTSRRNIGRI
jgi:TetR/AcrR family transcriptional repressor of nem operon